MKRHKIIMIIVTIMFFSLNFNFREVQAGMFDKLKKSVEKLEKAIPKTKEEVKQPANTESKQPVKTKTARIECKTFSHPARNKLKTRAVHKNLCEPSTCCTVSDFLLSQGVSLYDVGSRFDRADYLMEKKHIDCFEALRESLGYIKLNKKLTNKCISLMKTSIDLQENMISKVSKTQTDTVFSFVNILWSDSIDQVMSKIKSSGLFDGARDTITKYTKDKSNSKKEKRVLKDFWITYTWEAYDDNIFSYIEQWHNVISGDFQYVDRIIVNSHKKDMPLDGLDIVFSSFTKKLLYYKLWPRTKSLNSIYSSIKKKYGSYGFLFKEVGGVQYEIARWDKNNESLYFSISFNQSTEIPFIAYVNHQNIKECIRLAQEATAVLNEQLEDKKDTSKIF